VDKINENGELFTEFRTSHDLVTGGAVFPHKKCHKVIWVSSAHVNENQIDHVSARCQFIKSLEEVRNK
jgi:hypothetical protein